MLNLAVASDLDTHKEILTSSADMGGRPAFSWIDECLMGDIRTYMLGIAAHHAGAAADADGRALGGGNFSLPLLITSALEYLARMWRGDVAAFGHGYVAGMNVQAFMQKYFDGFSGKVAVLLWQTVRNGLHHQFWPRTRYFGQEIEFAFTTNVRHASLVWHTGSRVRFAISGIGLVEALERAVADYRSDLAGASALSADLRRRFVRVWQAVLTANWDDTGSQPRPDPLEAAGKADVATVMALAADTAEDLLQPNSRFTVEPVGTALAPGGFPLDADVLSCVFNPVPPTSGAPAAPTLPPLGSIWGARTPVATAAAQMPFTIVTPTRPPTP